MLIKRSVQLATNWIIWPERYKDPTNEMSAKQVTMQERLIKAP